MLDLELTQLNGTQSSRLARLATAEPEAAGFSGIDHGRIESAVREILLAIGEDPDRDGLIGTPRRVARAYGELFAGLNEDPSAHLARTFRQECDDVVIVGDIDVFSVCEHHLLPFIGKAYVAYAPSAGEVVGLSKLARVVEGYARRPQLQERLTAQIADALERRLTARGVTVVIRAEHLCMKMRGVRTCQSSMTTFAHRGQMQADGALRGQVLDVILSQMNAR